MSCERSNFSLRYPGIVKALAPLPAETVFDGEVVADEAGKPSFNKLQNFGSSAAPVFYFVFDLLVLVCRDVIWEPFIIGARSAGRTGSWRRP